MEDKIQQVRINFNKIKDIRNNVTYCFNALETKQTKLKVTTTEFVKNNRNNIFVFGLDSFQFQSKLIDYEYNDMKKFYLALNNRMYCEYYKLYKIILQYAEDIIGTNKNIEILKSNNIFPIYKDLEPLKQYNFDTIEEIHKTIISLLNTLNDHILFKETQLLLFQQKQKSGLNINNFVKTFDFDIIVIKQKCLLFLSYLDFFHIIHTKHFKRFSKKMKLMNDYLDEDIKFDEELLNREDDSLNSSASMASFDYNEDADRKIDKPSIKTLFKTNVTKFINTLNVIKPNNVIDNHLSLVKNQNINDILNTLSHSFDEEVSPALNHKYTASNGNKKNSYIDNIDTTNIKDFGINSSINIATINDDKSSAVEIIPNTTIVAYNNVKNNITSDIMKSIDGNIFEEDNDTYDNIKTPEVSVNLDSNCEHNDIINDIINNNINDSINDNISEIHCDINKGINVNIGSPSLEKIEEEEEEEEVENIKGDPTNKTTNKKKKKKKK